MKINLHCHTTYSDGIEPLAVMMMEHQRQGFSAFVVTDHVYLHKRVGNFNRCFRDFNHWSEQRIQLFKLGRYFEYPVIQGVELKIWGEEILLFGYETIKEVMQRIDDDHLEKYCDADLDKDVFNIVKNNKNKCACVWCHPRFTYGHEKILEIIDGYEEYNCGTDWAKLVSATYEEDLHKRCEGLKAFTNSDSHCLEHIKTGHNFHKRPIKSEEDLIKFIKGVLR